MSRKRYRVIGPPWEVQASFGDSWITLYYCASQLTAYRVKKEREAEQERWAKMTPEERMKAILR